MPKTVRRTPLLGSEGKFSSLMTSPRPGMAWLEVGEAVVGGAVDVAAVEAHPRCPLVACGFSETAGADPVGKLAPE